MVVDLRPGADIALPAAADSTTGFARLTASRLHTGTGVPLAEVDRRDGRWRVRAVGQGHPSSGTRSAGGGSTVGR